jgi:gamma-glutamyltranspeptidase / glutathione hydrolase
LSRAVSAPHHLAAEAGRRAFDQGGNAVDAAIAVVAAQGVVAPETCGLGGDLFALVHRPGWDRPLTLNSSGRAGSGVDAAAMRDRGLAEIPLDHPSVATIPGCVDGLVALSDRLGNLSLGTALAPAIDLARDGFPASDEQARAFAVRAAMYAGHPAVAGFYPGGSPVGAGATVSRPELADTLTRLAVSGDRDSFYLGPPGEDISEAVGGLITPDDLARSQAEWVDPVGVGVFGLTAWTTPPNSQGYLGPAALAVFAALDPPDDPDHPDWWHLLIEAFRCVAWERERTVSDPGHLEVDAASLLDPARLGGLASSVTDRAGQWPMKHARPSGTAYMCTADTDGMLVSIIQSNYRGLGSPFGAGRSGFLLQDRGLGFNLEPGHPNELGPGKRPLHTLSPTLWADGDQPRWAIGTRGGHIQPQLVAQLAARALGSGHDPESAQAGPRWAIADFGPGSLPDLAVEPGAPDEVVEGLRHRGHRVTVLESPQGGWGPMSLIGIDGDRRLTAPDPRVATTAALVF